MSFELLFSTLTFCLYFDSTFLTNAVLFRSTFGFSLLFDIYDRHAARARNADLGRRRLRCAVVEAARVRVEAQPGRRTHGRERGLILIDFLFFFFSIMSHFN